MRIVALIQARLSSNRLPGKVLRSMAGRPMLDHLCDSLAQAATLDSVVIATSSEHSDDSLCGFARQRSIDCYRGSLTDVAGRMLAAALHAKADTVVRVCGDSPLLDPRLVDKAVLISRDASLDLVTNVMPRSFPLGQSVEVMRTSALQRVVRCMTTADEREHVTKYIYTHADQFIVQNFSAPRNRADVRLSVDTEADFERCEAILDALGRPAWQAGWEACIDAYDKLHGEVG